MIEWAMLAALGFLAASLLALMLAPFLWRRAVHLTTLRVRSTLPLSLADIQADKDQLRAEFAMSLRKLEVKLEQVEEKLALQRVETARAEQAVRESQSDVTAKQNLIIEQEDELAALKEQLLKSEEESAAHLRALNDANRRLIEATRVHEEELARLHEMNLALDERRVELVALKTRLASADPALSLRIQSLLSQQEDSRRQAAEARGPASAAPATPVNGVSAADAVSPVLSEDTGPQPEPHRPSMAAPAASEPKASAVSATGNQESSNTDAVAAAGARKPVSLPVAGTFEIRPRKAGIERQTLPAAGPAAPAVPLTGTLVDAAPVAAQAGLTAVPDQDLQQSLNQLKNDLMDHEARSSGTDMRKRLSDMTARLTKEAIEADGADGKLARLLKTKGKAEEKNRPTQPGPVSLAKVSSVAAARASTSLLDRIKAFDKQAKN